MPGHRKVVMASVRKRKRKSLLLPVNFCQSVSFSGGTCRKKGYREPISLDYRPDVGQGGTWRTALGEGVHGPTMLISGPLLRVKCKFLQKC